ncbi:dTDP-4-dehydrorhamnose reductase [Pseudoxanthomonas sangjuensis]|uniref:dTDP-4-dehydrorhamnose reductase n=1 Tax=Pseudoxanthomonas sangjuensis TaxID=1503750 RepID=UPI001390D6DB|nr:dTDP-4-dehydrorhamnose reductase [Pseudoxanthomonas sangjuensis]KAF1714816.1 dTDP-4-dehydrorhamnose reductase [Pseudoxanthomonas sangjuensis]
MKILLLGANGQVGRESRRSLASLGDVVCATRGGRLEDGTECEAADFDAPDSLPALVERIVPDVVVNAAAYTAVDRAEEEVEAAFRANAEAPRQLAQACAKRGIPLAHYSTDYVFDGGGARPYREDDPTAPLGVYGASKLAGERAIQASGCRYLIFRTAWVYAAHGKNFLRTMLRLAAERDELRVVADQIGTPTPAALIADVTAQVLAQSPGRSGIWHLTASGETSWHGFARAIVDAAVQRGLLAKAPKVIPIATADYPTPARRPAYSRLDTSRLQADFGIELPDWREGMARVLDEIAASR